MTKDASPPNGINELSLEYEDGCYPNGPNYKCAIPLNSRKMIDNKIDDGLPTQGAFQYDAGDAYWVMQWDFCTPSGGLTSCW